MPITTGDFAKALWPGLNGIFNDTYETYGEECLEIFNEVGSDKRFEEYLGFSGLGLAKRKDEGSPTTFDTMQQGFVRRVDNVVLSLGFIITREARDDNQYVAIGNARARALGRSMGITKETIAANVLNRGFNAAFPGADGLSLYNAAHLTKTGITFSNTPATASDLSELALEQAHIDIEGFEDERGLILASVPRKLIIHRDNRYNADRILNSVLNNETNTNALNSLRNQSSVPEGFRVNHYLTDSDAWFLMTDINKDSDGMIYQLRTAMEFSNDTEFNTDNMQFKAYHRYAFDFNDVRATYGSPGA